MLETKQHNLWKLNESYLKWMILFYFVLEKKQKNCQWKLLNAFILIMYAKPLCGYTVYTHTHAHTIFKWIESEGFESMLDWTVVPKFIPNMIHANKNEKVLICTIPKMVVQEKFQITKTLADESMMGRSGIHYWG